MMKQVGLLSLIVLGAAVGVVFYLMNDVKTRPASADSPPHLPAFPEYEVEVCGWLNEEGAIDCFEQARSEGRGAEMWELWNTIEGDPVYLIHRSTPEGSIVVLFDSSADQWGSGSGFYSETCADLRLIESQGHWGSEPIDCEFAGGGWG